MATPKLQVRGAPGHDPVGGAPRDAAPPDARGAPSSRRMAFVGEAEELLPWEEPPRPAATPRSSNQGAFVRRAQRLTDPALHGFSFSTQSEFAVARALERRRVWWTALIPVRVNDDTGRRTRELDFLVITGGVPGILELDGGPHEGRAAEDHAKDRASKRAGIWVVERVSSVEALRDPDHVVGRFLAMLRAYARRAG